MVDTQRQAMKPDHRSPRLTCKGALLCSPDGIWSVPSEDLGVSVSMRQSEYSRLYQC